MATMECIVKEVQEGREQGTGEYVQSCNDGTPDLNLLVSIGHLLPNGASLLSIVLIYGSETHLNKFGVKELKWLALRLCSTNANSKPPCLTSVLVLAKTVKPPTA